MLSMVCMYHVLVLEWMQGIQILVHLLIKQVQAALKDIIR